MVNQRTIVEPIQREYNKKVSPARTIGGDAFTEITANDIVELIIENEINEADLITVITGSLPIKSNSEDLFTEETKNFTLKSVEKCLSIAKQMEGFLENDHLLEIFKINLQNSCLSIKKFIKYRKARANNF